MSTHPSPRKSKLIPYFILSLVCAAALSEARADDRILALFAESHGAKAWIESLRVAGTWSEVRLNPNEGRKWTWSPDGKWASRLVWKDGQAVIRVWNAESERIEADLWNDTELSAWMDHWKTDWASDAKWTTWAGKSALLWNLWKSWE